MQRAGRSPDCGSALLIQATIVAVVIAMLTLSTPALGASAARFDRVAMHPSLSGHSVLVVHGTVGPPTGWVRARLEIISAGRWVAVARAQVVHGRFVLRRRLSRHASILTVRAVAIDTRGRSALSHSVTLHFSENGSAIYSVPASTRLYPGDAVTTAVAGPKGGATVTFRQGSAPPIIGGHVALGPSPALPDGMFATVAAAQDVSGRWRATLRRAPIDEVLDDVSVNFDSYVKPKLVDARGTTPSSTAQRRLVISGGARFGAHAASFGSVFTCKTSGVGASADSVFSTVMPMPLSITLSNMHVIDQFDVASSGPFLLLQLSGQAEASIGFQAKKAFTCELSDSFRENHRIEVPLGAIGPVPVTMYLEPTLSFGVSESGSVSLTQRNYFAITLEQDGYAPFSARLSHSADPVQFNPSVAMTASLFAGGDLSVMFGGGAGSISAEAGIYGAFGPAFELAASTDAPGCLTATVKLEADLGVRLQLLDKRWSPTLAMLTSVPTNLGGPWCVPGSGTGTSSPAGGTNGVTASGAFTMNYLPSGCAWVPITRGSDGGIWFSSGWCGTVGRLSTSGTVSEYNLPEGPQKNAIFDMTTGPDGAIWFTEESAYSSPSGAGSIGRISSTGAIQEYLLPNGNDEPSGIVTGPDGALWFEDTFRIGRITPTGQVSEYPLPSLSTTIGGPSGMAVGADGALWFSASGSRIGRITTAGDISFFPLPAGAGDPLDLATGPDGAIWFTEASANIGRITPDGTVIQYPLPNRSAQGDGIAAGPDGAMWATENVTGPSGDTTWSAVVRVTTQGNFTTYPYPDPAEGLWGITAGPDRAMWFVAGGGISRIAVP
jgi:streptogramin lyase